MKRISQLGLESQSQYTGISSSNVSELSSIRQNIIQVPKLSNDIEDKTSKLDTNMIQKRISSILMEHGKIDMKKSNRHQLDPLLDTAAGLGEDNDASTTHFMRSKKPIRHCINHDNDDDNQENSHMLKIKDDFLDISCDSDLMKRSQLWKSSMIASMNDNPSKSKLIIYKQKFILDENICRHLPLFDRMSSLSNVHISSPRHIIVDKNDDNTGIIDLSNKLLGDQYAYIAINSLEKNNFYIMNDHMKHPCHSIKLRNNRISDTCCSIIISCISQADKIHMLDLSENSIGKKSIVDMASYMIHSHHLMHLVLDCVGITDLWLDRLCKAYMKLYHNKDHISTSSLSSSSLTTISFARNKITDKGIESITAVLLTMDHLQHINFSNNQITSHGLHILSQHYKKSASCSLLSLMLSDNNMGSRLCDKRSLSTVISSLLKNNSSLKHVDMSYNHINNDEAKAIQELSKRYPEVNITI